MITFRTHEKQLECIYQNQTIFSHSETSPSFILGTGSEDIKGYRGNYEIKDFITQKIELNQYRLVDQNIIFYNNEVELEVSFSIINERLHIQFKADPKYNRFWTKIKAEPEEKIYGCGAQPSYFNLRSRKYPLFSTESGVGRDPKSETTYYANLLDRSGGDYYTTYYPETTFVSTRKYWLHMSTYAYAVFDFSEANFHELYAHEVPNEIIISYKEHYLSLLDDLTNYTGRPPMLPSFLEEGMILGVQGGLGQVLTYLDKALAKNVKVSAIWCQDWAGIRFTSFGKRLHWNWITNEFLYPDLKNEIEKLKNKGVSFLGYINPFLLENESLFSEAKKLNFLVLNKNGDAYIEDFGEFLCGIVDLTNPEAFNWYKDVIKKNLIDQGMMGWMADFGEYLPVDCVLHNGVDAKKMHNEWPVLWAKCNYEAVREQGLLGKVFYFMRAGGHKSQHYATSLWAGDQSVNYELHDGLPSVIPATLSTAMTGILFMHSDIGGYTSLHGNIRTKELFERWLEMNVFSSMMRTHEGNRPATNFQFYHDDTTLDLMARMTAIRSELKPYTHHLIEEAVSKGYPMQRPLFLHYEEDLNTYDLQYTYLYGQDVLVAPVIETNQTVKTLYLPDDTWVHLWTGKTFKGSQEVTVDCPIGFPPVFYRKQSSYIKLFENITQIYGKAKV
jgi:sulfoquinovosidase